MLIIVYYLLCTYLISAMLVYANQKLFTRSYILWYFHILQPLQPRSLFIMIDLIFPLEYI